MNPLIVTVGMVIDLAVAFLAAAGLVSVARGEVSIVSIVRRNLDVVAAVVIGTVLAFVALVVIMNALGPLHMSV